MKKPNIIYIYADDLGRGMLSCYGQKVFRTPNIDRLAGEGVRFTRSYGTAFCAPARASLLTGMHDAHAGRWTFNAGTLYMREFGDGAMTLDEIAELIHNTGIQPCKDDMFLPGIARAAGYTTAQIGKLEWGFSTCDAELRRHGWDYHYGYYDHNRCHGYYPPYLFENGKVVDIAGNTRNDCGSGHEYNKDTGEVAHDANGRAVYSQDLFDEKILEFIRNHCNEPFFLYHPSQLPHGHTYYPDVFPEVASNPNLTPVEKEYASMVLRLDQTVGLILDELDRLGLAEDTLVLFSSDNGHENNYIQTGRSSGYVDLQGNILDQVTSRFTTESCGDVFNGNDGMSGLKWTNWEGGGRIPFIARWPGKIAPNRVSDHFFANYDTMATLADLLNVDISGKTDGISYLGELTGNRECQNHEHIVFASNFGPSLISADGWKLRTCLSTTGILDYRSYGAPPERLDELAVFQLYYLPDDYQEMNNLAGDHPDMLRKLKGRLLKECDGNLVHGTPQSHFAFYNH